MTDWEIGGHDGQSAPEDVDTYRIEANYGTFLVRRDVKARSFDEAFEQSGIADTLAAAGWYVSSVEGEEISVWRASDGRRVEYNG